VQVNYPPGGNAIHKTRLLSRHWIGREAFEIKLSKPRNFNFLSGQFVRILYQDADEGRDYSIASPPSASEITLCVQRVPEGRVSSWLSSLPTGEQIRMAGPWGYFVFRPGRRLPVFVATGTGVAPFRSMVLAGAEGAIILHGVRQTSELYYRETFEQCSSCRYVPCLSGHGPHDPIPQGAFRGRVTDYLQKHLPAGEYDFYLSGNSEMIRDAISLVDSLFPGSRVLAEPFF